MLPRTRSNSQTQSAGNTPTRYQGAGGRSVAPTLSRSTATRLSTPQPRPTSLLATPPAQSASTLRRSRRQSETGVHAWRSEQPPSPLLAGRNGVADDAYHTPTLAERRRPDSRASVYSAVSTQTGVVGAQSSGKQPVLVRSVRVDLKIVPPELDAARAERRGEVQHVSQGRSMNRVRVRGRMDVSVHVLHRGEQTVDLLAVAESHLVQRSRSYHHYRDDADAWPLVERTFCVVAGEHGVAGGVGGVDYAESVASPVLSPVLPEDTPTLSLRRIPTNDSQASPVLMRRGDHLHQNQNQTQNHHQHQQRSRPTPLFHVDQLSPYPPAPSTPSPPQAHSAELPDSAAARYETHTQASYARAQARVSDRVALYNELIQSQMRATGPQSSYQASRRTLSFGAERNGAYAAAMRPASAMGESAGARGARLRNGLLQRAATSPERPHSSMGLMSPTGLHEQDAVPDLAPAPAPATTGLGLVNTRRRSSSIASSDVLRDEVAASSDLCRFETDRTRGVLVARLSEPRRYRLTVWFSLPASSETQPSSDTLSWESGSASLRGIPRSLSTRVRVRLPHRMQPIDVGTEEHDELPASCFFHVRMLQPPRIALQAARVMDAQSASLAARSGRAALPVFSPTSPTGMLQQAPHDMRSEPGGWLLTDDSDADSGRSSWRQPAAEAEPSDDESVLDRKLRRFINEYGRRGSFSLDVARPPLIGDAVVDRRSVWARFEKEHAEYDFARTEVFAFKLRLADTLSVAWAPRQQPVYDAAPIVQPRVPELSPLLSQETMPFDHYRLAEHPPAFGILDTIDSVEPSPAVGAPPESLAFEPPSLPPAVPPTIESVNACITVRPDVLCLLTSVVLKHAGNTAVTLDFAPVLCAIGASRSLPLRHRLVTVDGNETSFSCGDLVTENSQMSVSTSRLRVQLPDTAVGETVELSIQSELSLAIPLYGMVLTQSFYVAVPTKLVTLVAATDSTASSVRAAIRVVNEADAWVRVDSDNMDINVLSLQQQLQQSQQDELAVPDMYEVVTIERRGSPLTASYMQRLVDAYTATSSPSIQPTLASSVNVSVDIECAPAAERLFVRVSLACSLSSFSSWRSQMDARFGSPEAASTACLAVVVPDTDDEQCRWSVDMLELAADASGLPRSRAAAAVPVYSVIDLGCGLVAVPLSQPASFVKDSLAVEVATDSLACAFTATVSLPDLTSESCFRLPAPLFDVPSAFLSVGPANMRYAQACDSLLTAASITVSLASGGTPLRITRSDDSNGSTIHCVLDASPGQPMVSQKLQVSLADLAGLRLQLSPKPEPPVIEYATRATDTDDLNPKAESVVANVADDIVVHEEHEDNDATAAVSCASSAVMLPSSPEPPSSAAVDSVIGDSVSVYSAVSNSSLGSSASHATGSLRNRHGTRVRSTMPSESDPLLGSSATDNSEQQSMANRAWNWAMWSLGLVLLMAVIGALLFAVIEFTSSVSASTQSHIPYEPSSSVHAIPLPTEVENQSLHRNRLLRVKNTDIYALARGERTDDDGTAFVVTNDGSHSFTAVAGDTSSLLGWVYQVFIEPILEALGANAYQ
ncbi:hypothetical protein IW150_000951 [Coemansia sp. RSA 2607]|nr:hypothetical protein IW150_000951 [Coemansia sp. RSA 2607]